MRAFVCMFVAKTKAAAYSRLAPLLAGGRRTRRAMRAQLPRFRTHSLDQ